MHVRCPECKHPIEIVGDTDFGEISCPACESTFSLTMEDTAPYQQESERTIAHFELLEKLGVGAFGAVWKARDPKLDRTVAVKLPRTGEMDAYQTELFLREARAAAQVNHPNIVTVHEIGKSDETLYIVSDYVKGLTLADWLSGKQPTAKEVAELTIKVARALHHAHEAGVVHRDLKPSNIMLDEDNEPHVMDFGLAKREAGEVTMTAEGQILGTPAYMSPEQARGLGHDVDRRSDIYSLGVMLFELLTGKKPFSGNPRMLLHQLLNEPVPSPRKLNRQLPRDLETICLKCLEKDPERRFRTAEEVADELQRFLDAKPIQSRPTGPMDRAWRWCRRNPVVATLVTAVSVIATVAGILAWQILNPPMSEEERFLAKMATLPSWEDKLEAVRSQLMEVNPEWNGEFRGAPIFKDDPLNPFQITGWGEAPTVENGIVTELSLDSRGLRHPWPLRALNELILLDISASEESGLPLHLEELHDLPKLKIVFCENRQVRFLVPGKEGEEPRRAFERSQLTELYCRNCQLTTLAGLRGHKLTRIVADRNTSLTDISDLEGMPLVEVSLLETPLREPQFAPLHNTTTLERLWCKGFPGDRFIDMAVEINATVRQK